MGISKSAFRLLLEEKKRGNLAGKKLLQLGRQHVFFTFSEALALLKEANMPIPQVTCHLSFKEELRKLNYIDDHTVFSLLGFEQVHSLDVSSYENATYVHDLNLPIPQELAEGYDAIFDGGTTEHVFSPPQVFANIHALLKKGGVVVHASPSHNHVDHGFYMFSPRLFAEYYSSNSYRILTSYFFKYSSMKSPWHVYTYKVGCLDRFSLGGFGKQMLGVWYVAQKQEISSCAFPQQENAQPQSHKKNSAKDFSRVSLLKKTSRLIRGAVRRLKYKFSYFAFKKMKIKKVGVF